MLSPVTHLCPFADEVDVGMIHVEYTPDPNDRDDVIELWGLKDFLASFHDKKVTHEELTQAVAERYPGAEVETWFRTAGVDVRCKADAVPRNVTV